MLDQPYMTDLIEANSMGHKPQSIHIYSASWGPTDDGKTVDGPRNATMRAIVRGVNEVTVISCSENSIMTSISVLNTCNGKTLSKYSLQSLYLNSSQIKYHMWKHFVDTSVF